MKKFILIIFIFNSCFVYSFENINIPQNTQNSYGYNVADSNSKISNDEIEILEKKIFKKCFNKDSQIIRISRLEKEIFGMEQKGNIEERFENLITASDYYLSGYKPSKDLEENKSKLSKNNYVDNYYYDDNEGKSKKPSKFLQFLSGIADILSSGIVTGYTMPIDSFDIGMPTGINTFGGTNYAGLPQFPVYYSPQYINPYGYSRPNYPYVPRHRHNYPPPKYNYYNNPYGSGVNNYKSGAGVKIIY